MAATSAFCSSGRQKRLHASYLTFIQANNDKNAKHKAMSPNTSGSTGGYMPPPSYFMPVRMGESLSIHPESKGAGCSSIISVCPVCLWRWLIFLHVCALGGKGGVPTSSVFQLLCDLGLVQVRTQGKVASWENWDAACGSYLHSHPVHSPPAAT